MATDHARPRDPDGPGVHEPVPRPLQLLLRRAVLQHATTERRRLHPPVLHVGRPGAREAVLAVHHGGAGDPTDAALRTDVVTAMLARVRRVPDRAPAAPAPMVWLTRTGPREVQDVDAAWLAASWAACAEAGLDLVWVVVDRHGWWDPRSGNGRTWRRLRHR